MVGTLIDERKTALLLAGGGTKGALQVGTVQYLINDRKWPIKWISGVSTGALQAVTLSQGLDYGMVMLEAMWLGLKKNSDLFIEHGWVGKLLNLVGGSSLASNEPLNGLLHRNISVSRIRESGIDCRVGVTNFNTKKYYQVGPEGLTDEMFLRFVLASTSIPGEFSGQYIRSGKYPDGWYFDGGVKNMTPTIDGLIDAGAERIVVVLCNPLGLDSDDKKYERTISTLKEALGITIHDNWTGDLARMASDIEWTNQQVRKRTVSGEGKRLVDFIVIAPVTLPIGSLEVDPTKIRSAIKMGHTLAEKAIKDFYGE